MPRALTRLFRGRFATILTIACVLQLIVALLFYPGCLVIDEVTYLAMTRALARGGALVIDNGWSLFPSPELEWEHARAVVVAPGASARLVAQYPYGFPLIVAPLHAALGPRAFVALNTLAFYGTVLVTRSLALSVSRKRALATAAALVFALGTYAWEYSFAVWPHAVTLFLCTTAVLVSLRASGSRRPLAHQLAAGTLVGLATTMRLDALFAMASVVAMPALVVRADAPSRTLPALASSAAGLAGLAPGLALLAVTNHAKFGSWQPLSYGPWHGAGSNTGLATYLPLAVLGAVALVGLHVLAPRAARLDVRRLRVAAVVVVTCALPLLALPSVRDAVREALDGLWMIVLDLRHSDPNAVQRGLGHSPRGAMMYVGALKKAFVQSVPWLPLAAVAPFLAGIDVARRRTLLVLALPIAVHVAVFGVLGWHGGLCLNLRYLLPALPFAAILATYGGYRLARRAPGLLRYLRELDAIVLIAAAAWIVVAAVLVYPWSLSAHELFLLDAPLVLAASLVAALVVARRRGTVAPAAALALALLGCVWAGMTEATYDAPGTLRARWSNRRAAEMVRAHTPSGAILFAEFPDLVAGVLDRGDVIAEPARDGFVTTAAIVEAGAAAGRPSFAVLSEASLTRLREAAKGRLEVGEPLARERGISVRRLGIAAP